MDQNVNATEALSALNRRLVEAVLKPLANGGGPDVAEVFKSLTAGLAQDTGRWFEIQNRYYQKQIQFEQKKRGVSKKSGNPSFFAY